MEKDNVFDIPKLQREHRILREACQAFYRYHMRQIAYLEAEDIEELLSQVLLEVLGTQDFYAFVRNEQHKGEWQL